MLAWLAARKWVVLAIAAAALIVGTLYVVNKIYGKGETAGASKVTDAVQKETIKKVDEARQDKEKADETVRNKPIDSVIDSLR